MKKRISWVAFVVFCMLISGCGRVTVTENTEHLEPLQATPNVSGVALSEGGVELPLDTGSDELVIIEDAFITNTKEINVSVTGLKGNEEVVVYLYNSEYMEDYIATSTLSANKNNFTFSHLISTTGYRIGANPTNLSHGTTIKIKD